MRIVSGKYKGKKLKEFSLTTTKPTLDRVKESMFDIIQFKVAGARVLDLFAGTGALGIEAVSRGASRVDFVDINADAIKLINQNLRGLEGDYSVKNNDYMDYLKSYKNNYDLILLDPPYASDFGELAIEYILKTHQLAEFGTIVLESSNDKPLNLNFLPTEIQNQIKELNKKNSVEFSVAGRKYEISKRKYGSIALYLIENIG